MARVQETVQLRKERDDVNRQVREQEVLLPLFRELGQAGSAPLGADLMNLSKKPMDCSHIVGVPDRFAKLAESCQLKLGAVRPRLVRHDDQSRHMVVEVQMTGAYAQLRPLFVGLLTWPCFIDMEQIEVVQQRMHEEFNMSIRLALE